VNRRTGRFHSAGGGPDSRQVLTGTVHPNVITGFVSEYQVWGRVACRTLGKGGSPRLRFVARRITPPAGGKG
jgi:hypothetical protein